MANRHLSRSIAMQSLYEWDFNGRKIESVDEIIKKNIGEFGPGMDDTTFVENLVKSTIKNQGKIDPLIENIRTDSVPVAGDAGAGAVFRPGLGAFGGGGLREGEQSEGCEKEGTRAHGYILCRQEPPRHPNGDFAEENDAVFYRNAGSEAGAICASIG